MDKLSYNPATGIISRNGKPAGNISKYGYLRIGVGKKSYQAHRLAWYLHHGFWPKEFLDHIDRNKLNNRIDNLREATKQENGMNLDLRRNNTSGYQGVSNHKQRNLWRARIWLKNKEIMLGYFKSKEDAYKKYCTASRELYGEFNNK